MNSGKDLYNQAYELCEQRKDYEAMLLFERAREMGYEPKGGYLTLMTIYHRFAENSKDETEMLKWYNKAIDIGDDSPFTILAGHYSTTYNVETGKFDKKPDWDKVFYYWSRHAQKWKGCKELGDCYFYGRGTPVDYVKAMEHYAHYYNGCSKINQMIKTAPPEFQRLAFEYYSKNKRRSGFNFWLAECYCHGYGVEADLEKAFRLYCDAYEKDGSDASAIVELDELSQMSFKYFSQKTDARGICFLGIWYHHRKQYDKALELFTKSAELGDARAMLYLGNMYRYGYGVEVDYSLAFEWISKSAGKNHRDGMFALADCYREGIGVPVDERKASNIQWMAIH